MPSLRTKKNVPRRDKSESFQFAQVIAMEILRVGFIEEIPRGRVLPKDHYIVKRYPEFFRLLGPRPDEWRGGNNDAA